MAALLRDQIGPRSAIAVAPDMLGQEGHLGGGIAKAQHVVEEEVLKLVWTHRLL